MNKHVRATPTLHTDRLSLMSSAAALPFPAEPEEMDQPSNDPALTIVPGPQFDALLALLDNPPKASEELRREFANRRWK